MFTHLEEWRKRSVGYLLVSALCWVCAIIASRYHRMWIQWVIAAVVLMVLGAWKGPKKKPGANAT